MRRPANSENPKCSEARVDRSIGKRSGDPRSREFLTPLRAAVRAHVPDRLDKATQRLANEIIQEIQNEPMPSEEELINARVSIDTQIVDEMNILTYSFRIQRLCVAERLRLEKDASNDDSGASVPKIEPWPDDLAEFAYRTDEDRARAQVICDQIIERYRENQG
jgi:hypothetical protein